MKIARRPGARHVGRGGLRVTRGERGPHEDEQQLDPARRRCTQLVEPVQQPVPERPGRSGLSGVSEDGDQHLLGLRGARGPG